MDKCRFKILSLKLKFLLPTLLFLMLLGDFNKLFFEWLAKKCALAIQPADCWRNALKIGNLNTLWIWTCAEPKILAFVVVFVLLLLFYVLFVNLIFGLAYLHITKWMENATTTSSCFDFGMLIRFFNQHPNESVQPRQKMYLFI